MKNWEKYLISQEIKRAPLSSLMATSEFIDGSGTIITKHGSLVNILRVTPKTYETLSYAELDFVCRQFEKGLRNLDGDMRLYQFVLKRPDPFIPTRVPETERMQFFADRKKDLFSVEFFFAITYEPKTPLSNREAEINKYLRIAARHLALSIDAFRDAVKSSVSIEFLDKDHAFMFHRRLLNQAPWLSDDRTLNEDQNLDWQIADSSVECDPVLRVGSHFARVLTLKDQPNKSTFANMLHGLLDIPASCVICSEWKPVSLSSAQSKAAGQQHHYDYMKTASSRRRSKDKSSAPPREDGGHAALADSITDVQRDIALSETYFGQYALTIVIYAEDPESLSAPVAKANNVMVAQGASLVEHVGRFALAAWLSCVPGNWRYGSCRLQIRQQLLSNVNYADLAFVFAAYTGNVRNEHFRDEYLAVVTNAHDQPVYINLHVGGVGHTFISGKSESGKTVLLNFLVENALKYDPLIFIFDILHGFRFLTERLGGAYIQLGHSGPGSTATINPFSLSPNEQNFSFLFSFIRLLIESDEAGSLANHEAVDLDSQIRKMYRLEPSQRRLGNLNLAPNVRERLDRWVTREQLGRPVKTGQYAYLFDNQHDSLEQVNFQTFNFPNLKDHPAAMEALVFYVIHWTSTLLEADPARPKFIIADEALDFLRHEASRRYFQLGLRRFRHYNAAVILCTQSLSHLEGSVAQSVFEQCSTRIFASNPGIDVEKYAEAFDMSSEQAALIKTLTPQRQFLLQDAGIFNLDLDKFSLALYSNSPYSDVEREKAVKQYGLERGLREVSK